ncbi:MAG: universal stress protein [Chthoniobacterales bacterium]
MKQSVLAKSEADLDRPHAENDWTSHALTGVRRLNAPSRHRGSAKITTVLVPCDLSERSIEAAHYAGGLAKKFGATVHFIHVSEIDHVPPDIALIPSDPVAWEEEGARALKERFKRTSRGTVSANFHERLGRPSDQICRLSEEIGADLVVMSTSDGNGLKRLFLGSNAERVVQHSSVPVIVVRSDEGQVIDHTQLRIQTILVPTDFSTASVEGLNYAISFAREFGARLVVFHAFSTQDFVTPNPYGLYNVRPTPEEAHSATEVLMRDFVTRCDFAGVEFETHITTSEAAEGICDYAEEIKADLIITSTHGRTGFLHVLIGSVAEDVVRYARSPVLVVPGSLKQKLYFWEQLRPFA